MDTNEIQNRIAQLPKGYISKKNIHGKDYNYLQWKENGKVRSRYIKHSEIDEYTLLINERKELELQLRIERTNSAKTTKSHLSRYYYALSSGSPAIGAQSFERIITDKNFYIDKTNLINEFWNSNIDVTLVTRPRRFGKTLNIHMLECFFSTKYAKRSDLFQHLNIWQNVAMRKIQGTYPVLLLNFGGVKSGKLASLKYQIREEIRRAYFEHEYILQSEDYSKRLSSADIEYFEYVCSLSFTDEDAPIAIKNLCRLLHKVYNKNTIILIDEYDTPLLEAFIAGTYDECTEYIRLLFNNILKTNPYLYKAFLTGITRISKESFFSDLNNIVVAGFDSNLYATSFGFTEEELFQALETRNIKEQKLVKYWYDGFSFGSHTDIYNPWSIVNYLEFKEFKDYWVNSSSNTLILDLFAKGSRQLKEQLEKLIDEQPIVTELDDHISFRDINTRPESVWTLLVDSGYLKVISHSSSNQYTLVPTNHEVSLMLKQMPHNWFLSDANHYNNFIEALLTNDIYYMNLSLSSLCNSMFSYFDVTSHEPERFYHGFFLGLLVDLEDRFIISSNRESGLGRYDIMMEPRNKTQDNAYIIEFKVRRSGHESSLEESCKIALNQIESKKYTAELISRNISESNIFKYGIAFDGKEVLVMNQEGEGY